MWFRVAGRCRDIGQPGAGGADFASILAMILPSEITDRFDIVGVDPRGTGQSSPIDCGVPAEELYGTDHSLEDEADKAADEAIARVKTIVAQWR